MNIAMRTSRREFLAAAGVGVAMVAAAGRIGAKQKPAADRPNIVMILADDQTYLDSGAYGNKDVKTPSIDRLASQGMLFKRCFTATAMCAPTRQQLYTGIFPVRNGAYPNHSQVKPGTKSIVHHLKALGYRVGLVGKSHFGPRESFPFERVSGGKIAEFIARDPKQPYCLFYASHSPHLPWKEGDASAYDPKKLTVPPYMVDVPEMRQGLCRYYAEITAFDAEVGKCMKAVDDSPGKDNTIFIYTSEQGMQLPYAKWTCYELGLRTALVIRWPKCVKPGSVASAMVQYVDVTPTLVDAAGGKIPEGLDGRSFLQVLLGKTDKHNDLVYGVHTTTKIIAATPGGYPIRSVRDEKYKYIRNLRHEATFNNTLIRSDKENIWKPWVEKAKTDKFAAKRVSGYLNRPAEELYDIVNDPHELNNLSGDKKYRPIMDAMNKKLQAWMDQQGDKGLETELGYKSRKRPNKKKPGVKKRK
ncbi:MAG: sulfatase [Phycisphaerales bacterium]|jgi:N-sulfoglucosamine sulfohydrolase|nr:sulfatase [Phycisphaerales bacterium]